MSRSSEIRAKLDHPIIDADGHLLEFLPAFLDCVRNVGGSSYFERYRKRFEAGHASGDWGESFEQSPARLRQWSAAEQPIVAYRRTDTYIPIRQCLVSISVRVSGGIV